MTIKTKKRHNRNETMFIFSFVDKEDFEQQMDFLELCIEESKHLFDTSALQKILITLRNRTDDRYADDNYKLSGLLFNDEMAIFTANLLYLLPASNAALLERLNTYMENFN